VQQAYRKSLQSTRLFSGWAWRYSGAQIRSGLSDLRFSQGETPAEGCKGGL